ncbi:MAG: hypothetical protein PSX79_12005 [bacterium]|nr:hypothetical protein [bacterium]
MATSMTPCSIRKNFLSNDMNRSWSSWGAESVIGFEQRSAGLYQLWLPGFASVGAFPHFRAGVHRDRQLLAVAI